MFKIKKALVSTNTKIYRTLFLYSKNFDASEAKENEKNETNSNALR